MHTKKDEFMPYARPFIGEEEIREVVDTLHSDWISKGPKVIKFEQEFAEYVGAKHAIAVNSCTAALFLALKAHGIGAGDEVITTPITFAASANVILHTGATPVFVDIDPFTLNIDAGKIEEAITSKTKAIIPVHFAGQSCEMDTIMNIAERYQLFVLEDAAHAVYTSYRKQMIGSIGNATAFSFYATKNLTTGEGGMLTTDDDVLAEKVRILSLHGMTKGAWNRYAQSGTWFYEIVEPGYKYNMTDMQASLGIQQLKKLETMQKRREQIAGKYNKAFEEIDGLIIPYVHNYGRHAWHLYVLQIDENRLKITRDTFIDQLKDWNIGTSVHFIPVHLHPYYTQLLQPQTKTYPHAEQYYSRTVSLPLYPAMSDEDVKYVIKTVKTIVSGS